MDMDASDLDDVSESQLNYLLREWTMLNASLSSLEISEANNTTKQNVEPSTSANLNSDNDFQRIFLQAVLGDEYCNSNEETAEKMCKVLDQTLRDSEIIDIEEIVPTFLLSGQNENANKPSIFQQMDFETFLENKNNIISVNCKNNVKSGINGAKILNQWNEPIPFLIQDILLLNPPEKMLDFTSLYGQTFKKVMFYGYISEARSGTKRDDRDMKFYKVDDGTGYISVQYSRNCNKLKAVSKGFEQLQADYQLARREGIPFLGAENYRPNTPVCKEMLQNIAILLKTIQKNIADTQKDFKVGNKVYVCGVPLPCRQNKVRIFAFDMYEDESANRDTEINFKKHLIRLYEKKYLKYTIDNKQETFWYSLFTTVHLTVGTNKIQEVKSYMDSSIEARECEHLNIFVRKLVNKCLEIQKTKN